jgi:bacterioferritin-associated ferredoxin
VGCGTGATLTPITLRRGGFPSKFVKCDGFVFIIATVFNSQPSRAFTAMIVCVCNRISDRDIVRFVRAGRGFDDIQLELGVATQCGNCESCARDVVEQCSRTHPTAALHCAIEPDHRGLGASTSQLATTTSEGRAWNSSHLAAA